VRLTGALLALALAGCGEPAVVRLVDGRPVSGRFIGDDAYALYLWAADAEARGDLAQARRGFEQAALADPRSPEIWTRIGALRCRMEPSPSMPPGAALAFDKAEAVDPSFGPAFRERARCLLAHGEAAAAALAADRAVALDPDDVETSLLRADALARAGRAEEARRALHSVAARFPRSSAVVRALFALARSTGDAALADEASRRAAELPPDLAASLRDEAPAGSPLAGVDEALRAGDLEGARRRALHARIPGSEVALRAVALGKPALARAQAELLLGADPTDASARIALAAAADLAGDLGLLARAMDRMPARGTPPSPLARLLFAEVLDRRVGAAAARVWLGEEATVAAPGGDALVEATRRRVRARLGAL
jgi:tetratricopeptide (TPR) repeat protein